MTTRAKWFEAASGYTAMAWLLQCIPMIPRHEVKVILGKDLTEAEVSALKSTNVMVGRKVLDRFTGREVRVWASPRLDRLRPAGWYQNELWNGLHGPAILASIAAPEDWLLLGEDLVHWGDSLGEHHEMPLHWTLREGGLGAGFLVRHMGGVRQEWVFFMERRRRSLKLEDTLARFVQEITPLLVAGTRQGLSITVRLLWTTQRGAEKGISCYTLDRRLRSAQRFLDSVSRPARRDGQMVPPRNVKWEHGLVYRLGVPNGWKVVFWEPENALRWRPISVSHGTLFNKHVNPTKG